MWKAILNNAQVKVFNYSHSTKFIMSNVARTSFVCSKNTCIHKLTENYRSSTNNFSVIPKLCQDKAESTSSIPKSQTMMELFVAKFPPHVQPYLKLMRLEKPIGTWLLLWPTYWSLALAAAPGCFPDPILLALFGAGAPFLRGAGCTINDLWDRDIDSKVTRTKSRPLASGDINTSNALIFLGCQLSIPFIILLQLNWYSVVLGAGSMLLVSIYPCMKRVTYYPQAVLGLAFNYGALLGWSAVHGSCDWYAVLPLYLAGISWTMVYDTIYAHQDKVDDVLAKVKSTALKFEENTKYYLSGFSVSMISFLALTGYICDQTWPYYVSVGITAAFLAQQIKLLNLDDPEKCWNAFNAHKNIGVILFLGLVAGNLLKGYKKKSASNLLAEETLTPSTDLLTEKSLS